MKIGLNRAQRGWVGGGGGGGGGPVGACCYETIGYVALQNLASIGGLVAGAMYHITDVTADWEIIIMAESTSTVSTQGQGIYDNSLFVEAWYELSTNTIQKIYDPIFNNEVEGDTNISGFLWNNALWQDNKIIGGSVVDFTGFTATEFKGNTIAGRSVLDLTNSTFGQFTDNHVDVASNLIFSNCSNSFFVDNIFNTAQVSFTNSSLNSIVENNITTGVIEGDSCNILYFELNVFVSDDVTAGITNLDLTNAVALSISGNVITGNALVDLTSTLIGQFINNNVSISSINLSGGTFALFSNNVCAQNSSIDFQNTQIDNLLGNIVLSYSTISANDMLGVISDFSYNEFLASSFLMDESTISDFTLNILKAGCYIDRDGGNPNITQMYYNSLSENSYFNVPDVNVTSISNNTLSGSSYLNLDGFIGADVIQNFLSSSSYISAVGGACTTVQANTLSSGSYTSLNGATLDAFIENQLLSGSYIDCSNSLLNTCGYNVVSGISSMDILSTSGDFIAYNTMNSNSNITIETTIPFEIFNHNFMSDSAVGVASTGAFDSITHNSINNLSTIQVNNASYISQIISNTLTASVYILFDNCISASWSYNNCSLGAQLFVEENNFSSITGNTIKSGSISFPFTSVGVTNCRIEDGYGNITIAQDYKVFTKDAYSNFEYILDMSNGSIYDAVTDTLSLTLEQQSFGGIFLLDNIPAGHQEIDTIANWPQQKYVVTFFYNSGAGDARFHTVVGGNVKLAASSPANIDIAKIQDYIQLWDYFGSGDIYEYGHKTF